MKIEYVESKRDYPKLCEIPAGTVFSPTNSIEIYIKLDRDGMSDIFTDNCNILNRNTLNIQGNDWEDCTDILAVVHLGSGTLTFIHRDIRVNPLDCKLVVEE
jgi:hypothetical protein